MNKITRHQYAVEHLYLVHFLLIGWLSWFSAAVRDGAVRSLSFWRQNPLDSRIDLDRFRFALALVALSSFSVGTHAAQSVPYADFSKQGECTSYGYHGPEAGLQADFEAFWNAHALCNGWDFGTINATVNFSANTITWGWSNPRPPFESPTATASYTEYFAPPPPDCKEAVGNPCDPATGAKYQTETDHLGHDGLPTITRSYNSLSVGTGRPVLGAGWTSSLGSRRLGISGSYVTVYREDGVGSCLLA